MTPGELVVILILACAVGLAVRALWKSHKKGGGCGCGCGDCPSKGICHPDQHS